MADPVRPEADDLKLRYMQSPHLSWAKFCEAEGLKYSWRDLYPTAAWVDEKKKIIIKAQGETLAASLFDRRFKWHKDVIHTLEEFPKLCDQVAILLAEQIDFMKKTQVKDRKVSELVTVAYATKGVVEAKYKALMIDKWSPKDAEDDSKPEEREADEISKGFHMKIRGMDEVSAQDIEKIMAKYLDKPETEDGD